MPSRTHAPGGKKTGQHMGDYPIPGGTFEKACIELIKEGFDLKWIDRSIIRYRSPAINVIEDDGLSTENMEEEALEILHLLNEPVIQNLMFDPIVPQTKDSSKQKYTCACGNNVWGKGGLLIQCKKCGKDFAAHL